MMNRRIPKNIYANTDYIAGAQGGYILFVVLEHLHHEAYMAKIILVEDELSIAKIVRLTLQSDGHDVAYYLDGHSGLVALLQEKPDLLLLDINLPDMTGFDLLNILKKDSNYSYAQPPTVMLTAQDDINHRLRGIEFADDYITKPFSPMFLKERVQRALTLNRNLRLPAPIQELDGHAFGRYKIGRKLATSDHAVLYFAKHEDFEDVLILKFFLDSNLGDKRRERFLLEIAVVNQLRHPYITPCYKMEKLQSGHICMVMPFIDGKKLKYILKQHELGLDLYISMHYAMQIAQALAHAHKHEVIHRDIKPDNIIVTPGNDIRMLDFGVAKLTKPGPDTQNLTSPGMLLGTMTHMAPELLLNQDFDHHIDIWSFGIVLFQMLTGKHPFKSPDGDILELLNNIMHNDLPLEPLEGHPQEMVGLIERLLQKDPQARPNSFEEVLEELNFLKASLKL